VVPIESGEWYEASAVGRVRGGAGSVSIRLSWYESGDGSGSQIDQQEGNVSAGAEWATLSDGPAQAPSGANSVRVRLVVHPDGPVSACFDDATFTTAEPPSSEDEPTAVPTTGQQPATNTLVTPRPSATSGARTGSSTAVAAATRPVLLFAPEQPGALRFSEVMSDPTESGRDADFEWVELANLSDQPVDLAGWKLGDSTKQQTLPSAAVPAHGYVVIAGPSAGLPIGVLVVVSPGGAIGNGLGNDGDQLILTAPNGEIGDEISYGSNTKTFDPAPPAPPAGQTLGIREPASDPASENWDITQDPTPGEANVFPPEPQSTVAGQKTAGPPQAEQDESVVVDGAGGGGPSAPWVVLMGLAGISAGVVGMRFGPRVTAHVRRRLGSR
jgi:hypothetical protein